jgi:archaellum component FlaC
MAVNNNNGDFNTRVEIELIKKDVSILTILCEKIDKTIDRIQDIAQNLSRMFSLQEQRIDAHEKTLKEFAGTVEMRRLEHSSDIKDIHMRISAVNKELIDRIEETQKLILLEIQHLRQEIKTEITEERETMAESNKSIFNRIGQIEAWKLWLTGALAFAAWLFHETLDLGKFISN